MHVGVLAFHGDFAEHENVLEALGVAHSQVRSIVDLTECTHLIIPGGESTVMARFLWSTGVAEEIQKRVIAGTLAVYGTCAGAILIAKTVTGKNAPKSLGLIDITMERNAYGAQRESFEVLLSVSGMKEPIEVSFIRAPKITHVGSNVEILASHEGSPVLVRSGRILAGTFHPEVRSEKKIHEYFMHI